VALYEYSRTGLCPRGVANGQRIRLAGQGGRGSDGANPGDLYLIVRITPHPVYRVEGRDLHVTLLDPGLARDANPEADAHVRDGALAAELRAAGVRVQLDVRAADDSVVSFVATGDTRETLTDYMHSRGITGD